MRYNYFTKIAIPIFVLLMHSTILFAASGKVYSVSSPDGQIKACITVGDKIFLSAYWNDEQMISPSPLSLTFESFVWGVAPKVRSHKEVTVSESIVPVYGNNRIIPDHYRELTLKFRGDYSLIVRAYNQGFAYRFQGNLKEELVVYDEELGLKFSGTVGLREPQDQGYETVWEYKKVSEMEPDKKLYLPLLFDITYESGKNVKLAVTESDVRNYPGLFLKRSVFGENSFQTIFEKYPLSTKYGGFRNFMEMPDEVAPYIARVEGTKAFPWRTFVIAGDDRELVNNTLVFCLATPQLLQETDWIKPGQVLWDWWHDYNIEGVGFETGINNNTYRYLIDFAAEHSIPYINIDWQWSEYKDLMDFNPDVNVPELVKYAEKKNVKVFVWAIAYTLERQMQEAMDMFHDWGVAGIKVDFFGRDDQVAVDMYERIARSAAQRKLMVNFHGCSKPTGLERAYPNIMNYEAVKGAEGNKWSEEITPDHDLDIVFIRQICGPMDYTPGAMRNFTKGRYQVPYPPGSQGTRCHQLAMYVVFPQPLVMLNDMPTAYAREPEYFNILKSIPVNWDETRVIAAEAGEYVVVAKRKDNIWYLGAMTNWNQREVDVDLSFLGTGTYHVTRVIDGVNAKKIATDYRILQDKTDRSKTITINLKQGGGAFYRFTPEN